MPPGTSDPAAVLSAFVENAPHRMGVIQLEGDDFRYVIANAACAAQRGDPRALQGRLAREVGLGEVQRQRMLTHAREASEGGAPVQRTFFETDAAGERWVTSSYVPLPADPGQPPRVGFVAVDITNEKSAEEGLRESEERYRTLFATLPDPVAIVRSDDGRFVQVNHAFLRQYGYTPDEAALLTAWDITNEPEKTRKHFADALRDGVAVTSLRWHKRKDGSLFPVETRTTAFRFRGDTLFCASLRDVSERRTMEAQLLLADRMATVGTLAAGVAHEINNPLSYVLSNLSWADEELARHESELPPALDGAELRRALREALHGISRVRDTVRDLKTFAQQGGGPKARLDVRRPIEVALRMAANEIRHRARLVREFDQEVPLVTGDEAQLAQVFLNLITNAIQALPERSSEQNEIRISAAALPRNEVAITVADNGRGMTEDQAKRVFDPFFTTRPVGLGQGLGLSVCLGIVRGLGGRIDVETEPDRGSVFRVVLPAFVEEPRPAPAAAPASARRRPRVLVIDDEPLLVRSYARMLASDHDIVTETDPRAALDRLLKGEQFDAVLCDIMMPQLSGIDLYDELCKHRPEMCSRTGFLTGGAFTPRAREFVDSRPGLSLEKPFDAKTLRELIARLMGA